MYQSGFNKQLSQVKKTTKKEQLLFSSKNKRETTLIFCTPCPHNHLKASNPLVHCSDSTAQNPWSPPKQSSGRSGLFLWGHLHNTQTHSDKQVRVRIQKRSDQNKASGILWCSNTLSRYICLCVTTPVCGNTPGGRSFRKTRNRTQTTERQSSFTSEKKVEGF